MTRTLIIGAGATGGALGARLISAGQDVTFLVRERRAAQLAADGLHFRAPDVDVVYTARAVTSLDDSDPFDLVIVAVKAPSSTATPSKSSTSSATSPHAQQLSKPLHRC